MLTTLQPYLLWLILGVVLIIVELVSQSFTILFFGIAALLVGLLKMVSGFQNLTAELITFAILGLAGIILLRKKMVGVFSGGTNMKSDENKTLILSTDIPANSETTINYQGTSWTAVNSTSEKLNSGTKVIIVRTEGIKLIVEPQK